MKATATEMKRLVMRGRNTSFDSQLSMYKTEDFSFSKLRERYKRWTASSFDMKDLISFGLADESGRLTNAGALIADDSPIRWSRLSLKVARKMSPKVACKMSPKEGVILTIELWL